MSPAPRLRDRLLPPLVSWLGPWIVRALGATWRVRRAGLDPFVARGRGEPGRYVIALWHSTLLPLAYCHRGEEATVLVSRHGDGEFIVRVLRRLGYRVARGSTTRGGAVALRELLRVARGGAGDLAITPDGPRGPAERAQAGVGFLAALTGFPILPLGVAVDRAWRFRSWDRFQVPKPFARVVIQAGPPLEVPREAARDEAALRPWLERFESAMADAQRAARAQLEDRMP